MILHAGALGDLVLTLQFALGLPAFARARRIEIVARAELGDLVINGIPTARRSMESIGVDWLYRSDDASPPDLLRGLVHGRFVLSALGGADSVVHRRILTLEPVALMGLDPRPVADASVHITEQWARQIAAPGVAPRPVPVAKGKQIGASHAGAFVRSDTPLRHTVVIHAGSGGRDKCWSLRGYCEVGRGCLDMGRRVVFVLGETECDRWTPADRDSVEAEFEVVERPSVDALLSVLSDAEVFVGNDSGPSHLAALVGAPVLTLFGPTDPAVWRPLGPNVHVLRGDCAAGDPSWGLSPATVVGEIARMIATRPA